MIIKELRTKAGLTQKQLSELLQIPKRTLEDWEGEKRNPPAYLVKLIRYYLEHEGYINKEEQQKNTALSFIDTVTGTVIGDNFSQLFTTVYIREK